MNTSLIPYFNIIREFFFYDFGGNKQKEPNFSTCVVSTFPIPWIVLHKHDLLNRKDFDIKMPLGSIVDLVFFGPRSLENVKLISIDSSDVPEAIKKISSEAHWKAIVTLEHKGIQFYADAEWIL